MLSLHSHQILNPLITYCSYLSILFSFPNIIAVLKGLDVKRERKKKGLAKKIIKNPWKKIVQVRNNTPVKRFYSRWAAFISNGRRIRITKNVDIAKKTTIAHDGNVFVCEEEYVGDVRHLPYTYFHQGIAYESFSATPVYDPNYAGNPLYILLLHPINIPYLHLIIDMMKVD